MTQTTADHTLPAAPHRTTLWTVRPEKARQNAPLRFPEDYVPAEQTNAVLGASDLRDSQAFTELDWEDPSGIFVGLIQRGNVVEGLTSKERLKAFVRLTPDLRTEVMCVGASPSGERPEVRVLATLLGVIQALKLAIAMEDLGEIVARATAQAQREREAREAAGRVDHLPWSEEGKPANLAALNNLTRQANPMAHWQKNANILEKYLDGFMEHLIRGWVLARGFERHMLVLSKISALNFVAMHPQSEPLQAKVTRMTPAAPEESGAPQALESGDTPPKA